MRHVGCFDTGTWVKIIGLLQLITSLIFVILLSVLLRDWVAREKPTAEDFHQSFLEENVKTGSLHDHYSNKRSRLIAVVSVFLISQILSGVMAIGLLFGSYNRRPEFMRNWLYYASSELILLVVLATIAIAFGISGSFLWVYINMPILIFAIYIEKVGRTVFLVCMTNSF